MSALFLGSGWCLMSTSFATLAPLSAHVAPLLSRASLLGELVLPPNRGPQSYCRARLGAEPTRGGQRGLGRG